MNQKTPECRIGVYVCHCGTNISKVVNVVQIVAEMKKLHSDVIVAKDSKFMCSEPGQEMIIRDIREHELDRIVVASCSPLMHESTFRAAVERAGLNRYLFEMVNIREQCSWVTLDGEAATQKARRLVNGGIARVRFHEPLQTRRIRLTKRALVIGGGIAGIETALQVAEAGYEVILLEKEESIGGHMARFDKTFPTLDCAACILTPKMVAVGKHPRIRLMTYAELEDMQGYIGNFKVTVRKKARFVDPTKCNSCGSCCEACPCQPFPLDRSLILGGQVFKEGRRIKNGSAAALGQGHDVSVLTSAQPMPEQVRKPQKEGAPSR